MAKLPAHFLRSTPTFLRDLAVGTSSRVAFRYIHVGPDLTVYVDRDAPVETRDLLFSSRVDHTPEGYVLWLGYATRGMYEPGEIHSDKLIPVASIKEEEKLV